MNMDRVTQIEVLFRRLGWEAFILALQHICHIQAETLTEKHPKLANVWHDRAKRLIEEVYYW